MKMKVYGKKLVCRLLVVVMVISLFPAISAVGYESQTEDGWKYEEYYGNIKITGYLGDETNVTIPSKIDGVMVTEIGDSLYLNSEITSITIPESVERIGVTWFRGLALRDCDKLQSINVDSNNQKYSSEDGVLYTKDKSGLLLYPKRKTGKSFIIPDSVKYFGSFAFSDCTQLTSITIPNSVISIGKETFSGCTGLKNVTIPNRVTAIGQNAFRTCTGLTNISIPNSVTKIGGGAFGGCYALESVVIPESVTSIGEYAFGSCTSLKSIVIPANVTSMGKEVFYYCEDLKEVKFMGKKPKAFSEDPREKNPIFDDSIFKNTHKDLIIYYPKWYEKSWRDYTYYTRQPHYEGGVLVQKIEINKRKLTIQKKKKQQLRYTLSPINATNKEVTWKSSNPKVATVSQSGVVTAKRKGKCTITIITDDGNKKSSYKVSVIIPVTKVKLNKKKLVIAKGKRYTLRSKVTPKEATNQKVYWKSSNKKVATVSKKGVVKARKKGKCTITVITKDGNKKARCKILVQ
ncbi:MAG: leucine-rich repeat protein [Eubacterium sp.]|jgi:uncharacterized protein YjdB|nr:leucine-rich repeat protein [Eubacterium sp.]